MGVKPTPAAPVDELMLRQVASLVVLKKSVNDISKELNLSYPQVKRLVSDDRVKAMIKEIGEGAVASARSLLRRDLASIAQTIADVLRKKIEEGDLNAIDKALRILGCLTEEPIQAQATQIIVKLPGESKSSIEVPSNVISTEN